ncbi:MAG: PIG-L deacetylase family protein [Candidatus Nanopelagicales bacterium]|nr:PIG-L deacetylase family protein [Candidatus Nanopelagicales bacterium]MDZ4248616.1 PIG-L deacetylase family protein [Candidatus Nanopelagicales bacterium]
MDPTALPERVLTVTAHPDDVDFGAGGTVAGWTAEGVPVSYCVVTDGDAGGFDPGIPRAEIPGIRRSEQRAAGRELGVTDIHFLGYHDGELTVTHGLRRDIARVIRKVRPSLVLIQSPVRNLERMYASHPDHLAAGEAAMQAVYPDARNPFAHPTLLTDEALEPWPVPEVWLMGFEFPDHWVDITGDFPLKLAALRAHRSQTGHLDDLEERIRSWGERTAADAGLAPGRIAEAFKVLDTR